jgi:outer membrane protein
MTVRISTLLLSLFTFVASAHAQQTRVAYIDAGKLLKRMPEVKDAQARLDQLTSSWTKEATDMQSDIDRKQAEFDRRKLIMTDAERNAAELDLTNLTKKHTDFLHSKFDQNGGDLFAQEAALMKPAYDKLSTAVKECAADGNYDYVFDRSSKDVVMLYTNSKFDLTLPVARKLGIESEILSTPLVNNGPKTSTPPNGQMPPATGTPNTGTSQNPAAGTGQNGIMPNGTPNPPVQPGVNPGGTNPNPPQPVKVPGSGH